jgi:hypothetical protein
VTGGEVAVVPGSVADCTVMKRILVVVLLALGALAASTTPAQARPLPCVQYNDPIHMGSYQYCPLG